MGQRIRKTKDEMKKKYNATYRLRQKIGEDILPKRSRIIQAKASDDFTNIPETKILTSEFGFIIKQELF